MEFIILTIVAFAIFFTFAIALLSFLSDKTDEATFYALHDLGRSLQQEILLSTELVDGYNRMFEIPDKINNVNYNIQIGNTTNTNGYIILLFKEQEIYYKIPIVNGTFLKGENHLRKVNGTLLLNN